MGILIQAGLRTEFPFVAEVRLECDDPASHAQAMKDGWLERQGPNGRLWFCPRCSGK